MATSSTAMGGEEGLITLPEQTLASAELAAERVRRAVGELAIATEGGVTTISIGVAERCEAPMPRSTIGFAVPMLRSVAPRRTAEIAWMWSAARGLSRRDRAGRQREGT